MRVIEKHRCADVEGDLNHDVKIEALDAPGAGGASHHYWVATRANAGHAGSVIRFQQGPIGGCGPNGISMEALIAVCIDRLEGFQGGPAACEQNRRALEFLEGAMYELQDRTRAMAARRGEGTHAR